MYCFFLLPSLRRAIQIRLVISGTWLTTRGGSSDSRGPFRIIYSRTCTHMCIEKCLYCLYISFKSARMTRIAHVPFVNGRRRHKSLWKQTNNKTTSKKPAYIPEIQYSWSVCEILDRDLNACCKRTSTTLFSTERYDLPNNQYCRVKLYRISDLSPRTHIVPVCWPRPMLCTP